MNTETTALNAAIANELGDPLSQDPKILQARVDSISSAFGVERILRDALLDYIEQNALGEAAKAIRGNAKAYAESCYAMIADSHRERTGEDLFAGDENPTDL